MRKEIKIHITVGFIALAAVFLLSACGSGDANSNSAGNASANADEKVQAEKLGPEALDNLLAPVALYPDPLLAQVLPASSFPGDISKAAKYVKANGDKDLEKQDWPVSVKSVAHYPDALYYMDENPDWTTTVGQAYVLQPADVLDSIQRLRLKARDNGALVTTKQQDVRYNDGVVKIYPAEPNYLYVPQYDPQQVYYARNESGGNGLVSSLIKFGAGVAVGLWLNNAFDWNRDRVYYHGWRENDGWVGRTRNYYGWNDDYYRNSYYVNDRYRTIYVNRDVLYRPVRYDRIRIYDRIFPGVNYRGNREKEVPGLGDEMRRQNPGRPIEKGPPPGQIKKDKYGDRRGPRDVKGKPKLDRKPVRDNGNPSKVKGPGKKSGPPASKGKSKGGGGKGEKEKAEVTTADPIHSDDRPERLLASPAVAAFMD